jgi:outer membrane protein assembly factor BamB
MKARRVAALIAAALLSGCISSHAPDRAAIAQESASWATYQHSADRNAVFPRYVLPDDWAYDTKAKINGGLALVGNTLLFTTFSKKLVALNVRNGHELWHANLPNIAMTTPIVAGSTVYIGTGKNGTLDRRLHPKSIVHDLDLKLQFGSKDVWGIPGGDEIAAFDLRTGAPRWTYRTVGEDMPSPVYHRGLIIFANGEWRAYALRADTGRQVWKTDVGGVSTMSNAVVAGSAVVVGVCTNLYNKFAAVALDPASGKILWRSPYGHCDQSPAYADGKVFVSSTLSPHHGVRRKATVAALDAKTGKPIWVFRQSRWGVWSTVASGETAIAGTYASGTYYQPIPNTDEIVAFNGDTGKIRWRFHTTGPVKMSPVVVKDRLYVGDTVGLFYTLDAYNGRLLELRASFQPFTTTPPIVAGNKLIVANGTSVYTMPLSGFRADHQFYLDEILAGN